ncbi:DUF47 domain-containing protein [Chloroflexota bacterium]
MPQFSFIPREEKFFELFKNSARNLVSVASEFRSMVDECEDITRSVAELTEMEHQGDDITHTIIALLHLTFVPPFDRGDIANLAQRLDDVVDLIHEAAEAMLTYNIESTTLPAKELADILVKTTKTIEKSMPILEKRNELRRILRRCEEINRLEHIADKVYRAALSELFKDTHDFVSIIKWREVYDLLESAINRCKDIANILEGIALKYG